MDDRIKLKLINLKGYKSINKLGQDIPIGDLTVLLGANGAGKSNLVSFFTMLNYLTTGALQRYIGESGSANSLLYYGSKQTSRLEAKLVFENETDVDNYKFSLAHAAGDTLIFTEETIIWHNKTNPKPFTITLDPGIKESGLFKHSKNPNNTTSRIIYNLLRSCQVFQFHDTSSNARLRNKGYIGDNRFLYSDAGNLAAFLYSIKNQKGGEQYYNRILRHISQIMPQFGDFDLYPSTLNENNIILNWKEKNSDYVFGPHQISDGSLRFMAIATLLLQPPKSLPSVIILDEPELGLHPSAISALAGMAKAASQKCQVILATQSPRLVDEFAPENIVIVERDLNENCSKFKTLDSDKLADWIEQYSMSELWEKNVIGGQP